MNNNVDNAVNWYVKMRPIYKNLANKVESIIREVLNNSGVSYYTITSRAKEIDSFSDKAKKDKYKNPQDEIKDLAGIRVITFVKNEVNQCCEIIKPLFEIDPLNSVDKTKELGNDKVGYRSIHFVAKLTKDRLVLPEYKIFEDLCFEIQVRTILEHAWADISHDRNYKFSGVLPPDNDIQRRFSLVAATLELVDREFDNLAKEIAIYENDIKGKVAKDELNIELNTTAINNYLSLKFKSAIENGLLEPTFNNGSIEIIEELKAFGITTLQELDTLIGSEIGKYIYEETNYLGLLRDIMMINNVELYFEKAWNRSWSGITPGFLDHYSKLGIDIASRIDKYKLHIEEDDDVVDWPEYDVD